MSRNQEDITLPGKAVDTAAMYPDLKDLRECRGDARFQYMYVRGKNY